MQSGATQTRKKAGDACNTMFPRRWEQLNLLLVYIRSFDRRSFDRRQKLSHSTEVAFKEHNCREEEDRTVTPRNDLNKGGISGRIP